MFIPLFSFIIYSKKSLNDKLAKQGHFMQISDSWARISRKPCVLHGSQLCQDFALLLEVLQSLVTHDLYIHLNHRDLIHGDHSQSTLFC